MKALLKMGIRGVTVSDVRGFGSQGGSTERHGGKLWPSRNIQICIWMAKVIPIRFVSYDLFLMTPTY